MGHRLLRLWIGLLHISDRLNAEANVSCHKRSLWGTTGNHKGSSRSVILLKVNGFTDGRAGEFVSTEIGGTTARGILPRLRETMRSSNVATLVTLVGEGERDDHLSMAGGVDGGVRPIDERTPLSLARKSEALVHGLVPTNIGGLIVGGDDDQLVGECGISTFDIEGELGMVGESFDRVTFPAGKVRVIEEANRGARHFGGGEEIGLRIVSKHIRIEHLLDPRSFARIGWTDNHKHKRTEIAGRLVIIDTLSKAFGIA